MAKEVSNPGRSAGAGRWLRMSVMMAMQTHPSGRLVARITEGYMKKTCGLSLNILHKHRRTHTDLPTTHTHTHFCCIPRFGRLGRLFIGGENHCNNDLYSCVCVCVCVCVFLSLVCERILAIVRASTPYRARMTKEKKGVTTASAICHGLRQDTK